MTNSGLGPQPQFVRVADLSTKRATAFELVPDATLRAEIAQRLDLLSLKKLRLTGQIEPMGQADWALKATIGATVVQPCVSTLEPVTTRIDEPVIRHYLAHMPEIEAGEDDEIEMPEDETAEPLPAEIDLLALLEESLALALPLYPRADGVETAQISVTEPGKTPMSDADAKPFAALKALKDQLGNSDD